MGAYQLSMDNTCVLIASMKCQPGHIPNVFFLELSPFSNGNGIIPIANGLIPI